MDLGIGCGLGGDDGGGFTPAVGLISAWELNEVSGNALDSHGANTLTDNATVASATGLIYPLARDCEAGNLEFFERASNPSLLTGDIDFTFEAWLNPESLATSVPFAKVDNVANNYQMAYINGAGFRWGFGTTFVSHAAAIVTGTWYQLIAYHDAANELLGLEINAVAATPAATGGVAPPTNAAAFRIGSQAFVGGESYWDGLIGPVRMWKRLLKTTEKAYLWNAGAGRAYPFT